MSREYLYQRIRPSTARPSLRALAVMSALAGAIAVAGCSADVARFDFPGLGLNDDDQATGALPSGAGSYAGGTSLSDQSPDAGGYGAGSYVPPSSSDGVQVSALPEPPAQGSAYDNSFDSRPISEPAPSERAVAPRASPAPEPGDEIVIRPGDTLYGLSRRHGTSISELMSVNGLTKPDLWPGQKLRLPAGVRASAPQQQSAPVAAAAREPAPAPSDWNASYEIQSGDSLYKIARAYNTTSAQLQSVNGITDPRRLRPGTVIKVPGSEAASVTTQRAPRVVAPRMAEPAPPVVPSSSTQPRLLNSRGEQRMASAGNTASDAMGQPSVRQSAPSTVAAPATTKTASLGPKLRWPVRGKVVVGFGARSDGSQNDGINLAVPMGTDVHAAEDGVVAYAGDELKGYGNLVLIRHDNGWVTAYAHNDQLKVKRGDKVTRGQVIAKAGKTGSVDQPQVHFELRQGAKPVDPLPYMERL